MAIALKGYPEVRVRVLDYFHCGEHPVHRPLIHGNHRDIKPPLLPEMRCKRLEHPRPEFLIFSLSRDHVQEFQRIACLVKILERQPPRYHGIAVDLTVHPERHHEFNPHVKHGIVEQPCPVRLPHPCHHTLERVVCLAVPWLVGYRCSNHLAAGIRIQLHYRAHHVKMRLAERPDAIISCHSIRILPQVQMKIILLGKCPAADFQCEPQ